MNIIKRFIEKLKFNRKRIVRVTKPTFTGEFKIGEYVKVLTIDGKFIYGRLTQVRVEDETPEFKINLAVEKDINSFPSTVYLKFKNISKIEYLKSNKTDSVIFSETRVKEFCNRLCIMEMCEECPLNIIRYHENN